MSQDSSRGSSAAYPPERGTTEPTSMTSYAGQDEGSSSSQAKEQGRQVAGQAKQQGQEVAGQAKQQGQAVAGQAKHQGQEVAGTAKQKAGDVRHEAEGQARQLLEEGRGQLDEHAGQQQQRAAQALSSVRDELQGMVQGTDQQGPVTDLARQATDRVDEAVSWLSNREPSELLGDVRRFGSRRPGTFLALAAGAGLVAGRLARGLKDSSSDSGTSSSAGTSTGGHRGTTSDRSGYVSDDRSTGTPLASGTSTEPMRGGTAL